MAQINQELRKAAAESPYVELYEFDGRHIDGSLYFHFTPSSDTPISFGGLEYEPFPIQGKGWEVTTGQLPRPKLTIANVNKVMQPYLLKYQDLTKMKITRLRTLARFLDGQPDADGGQHLPAEVYFINAMTRLDRASVEFELVHAVDLPNIKLPRAQALRDDLTVYDGNNNILYPSRHLYAPGLTTGRNR